MFHIEAEILDWITVLLFKYSSCTVVYNIKGQLQSKKINKYMGLLVEKQNIYLFELEKVSQAVI